MYEVVYFVLTPDFSFHMDIQQRINFHILDRFAHERIQFAFPTRTVYAHVSQLADV
jgi:small-conductance mechanosensitive channel